MRNTELKIKEFIYPITLNILKIVVDFKFVKYYNLVRNENENENELENYLYNNEYKQLKKPVLYVINHSNVHDFPAINHLLKDHFIPLSDIQNKEGLNGVVIDLNGAIYVKRDNKSSRLKAAKEIKETLKSGYNVLMMPEGTWNLSDNSIVLPFSWGIIDIAKECDVKIVPIIMEFKNMDKKIDRVCYANFGIPIDVNSFDNKMDAYNYLRNYMATLRWNLWELFEIEERKNQSKEEFDLLNKFLLSEYPRMDYEEEKKIIYKPYVTEEEVFARVLKQK